MAAIPLSAEQIETLLAELPAWSLVNGKLHRELRFADFSAAFGFLTQVALALLGREHVLMTGPPGTAKSQIASATPCSVGRRGCGVPPCRAA